MSRFALAAVTDAGTLTYCVAQVGATEVKYIEPKPGIAPAPMRLAIYLHGDGASTYNGSNPRSLYQDSLLQDIQAAEQYLTGLQFPVNDKVIAGAQHCAFDQVGRVTEVWNEATAQ
ncbi:hypothetical protein NR800_20295 [Corallococcus interemptor]|uniref:hypothetical protein n=1 Tax=Corallococcus interemptor TaxID=2316720 RepID=UPI0035D4B502